MTARATLTQAAIARAIRAAEGAGEGSAGAAEMKHGEDE